MRPPGKRRDIVFGIFVVIFGKSRDFIYNIEHIGHRFGKFPAVFVEKSFVYGNTRYIFGKGHRVILTVEFKIILDLESPSVYQTTAREKAVDALLTLIGGKGAPKNCANGVVGMENLDAQLLFTSGKALMMPNASWLEIEMLKTTPEGFEMVLIAPPTIEGGSGENNLYGHVDEWLIIPSTAENKEAAKKFVSFIFSEKGLVDFFEKTSTTSVFKADYTKANADSLTGFGKSVLSLRSSRNIFYTESSSPLMYMGLANFWQYKMVTEMVTQGQTAKEIVQYDYDHVVSDWASWQKQI